MITAISEFSLVTEDMLKRLKELESPFGGRPLQDPPGLFDSNNIMPDYSPFYEILDLNEDFTKEELDRAYKKARIKYHPDKFDGDKEKFELSTEAYLKFKYMLRHKNITQR